MPLLPIRYSASSSRQPSDAVPQRRSNQGASSNLSPRAESFNPALIPLLPAPTLSSHRDVYIHPRSSIQSNFDPEVPQDMAPRSLDISSPLLTRSLPPLSSDHEETTISSIHQHLPRQQTNPIIPYQYKTINSSPAPGAVAGITLGAVAGFLVLFWLFITLIFTGRSGAIEGDESEIVISRSHRSHHKSKRTHRSSHHSHREMSEAPKPRPPPSRSPSRSPSRRRTERIVVEETTRRTERSRPPPPTSRHTERETIIEESRERRVDGDDVVEVIEEHSDVGSPPQRKKSGYRTVDPNQYAGGNYPRRDVNDRRKSSRR